MFPLGVVKVYVTKTCTSGDSLTARPEGGSLALGQKFYHDGNSKAESAKGA